MLMSDASMLLSQRHLRCSQIPLIQRFKARVSNPRLVTCLTSKRPSEVHGSQGGMTHTMSCLVLSCLVCVCVG